MKALIAMSGGVDSAVAAYLMKEQYECAGCTMRLRDVLCQDMEAGVLSDIEDARSVAQTIGIPFYVFDFREHFQKHVIQSFVESYKEGLTPNPCIECNHYVKFGAFYEEGRKRGFDVIATGHYARIEKEGDLYLLKKGRDLLKDQSYVLYTLTQDQLAHTQFPLGDLDKTEVRRIAEEKGFVNAHRRDSQDICFVPDHDYARIIEEQTGRRSEPGDFVDESGNVLGKHKGIIHYTVGQHRGLGLPTDIPLYVKQIDAKDNRIVLCENNRLFSNDVRAKSFNWISGTPEKNGKRGTAKIRYRHKEQPCTIYTEEDGTVLVRFDESQRAATPGQSCVVYDGDGVLGGGIIL